MCSFMLPVFGVEEVRVVCPVCSRVSGRLQNVTCLVAEEK